MPQALETRPGYRSEMNSITKALCDLRARLGLRGAVLITFTDDRYGTCSSGDGEIWGPEMDALASKILMAIDDGKFDPSATKE